MSKSIKYIDSRMVSSKSRIAFKKGVRNAMAINGYVIVAQDGWIIKKCADGRIDRIHEVPRALNRNLNLD